MDESKKCKLFYFPIKALAEPIRFLLRYGGIQFEDIRMDREQWKEFKEKTPFERVPVLEIDGKLMHQSVSICRYLGSLVQLSGANPLENLEIDSIVDTISDIRTAITKYNQEDNNSPNKSVLMETLLKDTIPFYLSRFDNIAKSGFMALGRLTWADLYFVGILDYCNGVMKTDILNGYKHLMDMRSDILNITTIKEWIESRPLSDY